MSGKPTPGPWRIDPRKDKRGARYGWFDVRDSSGRPVIQAGSCQIASDDGEFDYDCGLQAEKANATLIAAAPAMLEALRGCARAMERATEREAGDYYVAAFRAALEVIAKAEGRP